MNIFNIFYPTESIIFLLSCLFYFFNLLHIWTHMCYWQYGSCRCSHQEENVVSTAHLLPRWLNQVSSTEMWHPSFLTLLSLLSLPRKSSINLLTWQHVWQQQENSLKLSSFSHWPPLRYHVVQWCWEKIMSLVGRHIMSAGSTSVLSFLRAMASQLGELKFFNDEFCRKDKKRD